MYRSTRVTISRLLVLQSLTLTVIFVTNTGGLRHPPWLRGVLRPLRPPWFRCCLLCGNVSLMAECKKGYYKESSTPEPCRQCPANTTTDDAGATHFGQCQLLPGNDVIQSPSDQTREPVMILKYSLVKLAPSRIALSRVVTRLVVDIIFSICMVSMLGIC